MVSPAAEQTGKCRGCGEVTGEPVCPTCGALNLDQQDADLAGTVINGQYELQSLLGRGGMSVVYRGIQLSMERPVAIKILPGRAARDSELARRFRHEARITSRLVHPNTVRVHDFGISQDGHLFLVMELLSGEELSR